MNVETISQEAIIPVIISGSFAVRVQNLLLFLLENKEPDYLKEVCMKISESSTDLDTFGESLETVMGLIAAIESSAKANGQVNIEKIEVEKP
jgi:hypothetical protein